MSEKSLDQLLNARSGGGLGEIVERARAMGELVAALQNALPAEERSAIAAANIRGDGELVVLASSSAWASRLRYEADTLLGAAQQIDARVNRCTVRVSRE